MKNIILLSILFIISSCSHGFSQKTIKLTKEQEKLKAIAPEKRVEKMRIAKPVKREEPTNKNKVVQKVNPNNRIEFQKGKQSIIEDRLEFKTEIKAINENRIRFANDYSLNYWVPSFHKVNLKTNTTLNVQYQESFIGGAFFKSVRISSKNNLPAFSIVSTGADSPIVSNLHKELVIKQTKKEIKFKDNKSETIKEVIVVVNGETKLSREKPTEVKVGNAVYLISVNKSWHYYPKGNDSFESPEYILEYTLTRIK